MIWIWRITSLCGSVVRILPRKALYKERETRRLSHRVHTDRGSTTESRFKIYLNIILNTISNSKSNSNCNSNTHVSAA